MGTASPGGAARGSPADDSGLGAASRTEGAEERARQAAAGRAGRAADPALRKRVAARPLARRKVWRAPAPPGEVAVGFVCLFFLFLPPSTPPRPPRLPWSRLGAERKLRGKQELGSQAQPGSRRLGSTERVPSGGRPGAGLCAAAASFFNFFFFFSFIFFFFFSFLPSPFFLPARFSLRFNICFWRATSPRAASPPSHVGGHLCRGESGWLHTEIGAQGSEAEALAGLLAVPQPEQPGGALAAAPAQRYRRPPAALLPYRCPRAVSPCLPPGPPPRSRARFGGPCSCSAKRASCGTAVARCPEGCPRYLAPLLRVT